MDTDMEVTGACYCVNAGDCKIVISGEFPLIDLIALCQTWLNNRYETVHCESVG